MTSDGTAQKNGTHLIGEYNSTTHEGRMKCLRHCQLYTKVTACEIFQTGKCFIHTKDVSRGSGVGKASCWPFSKCLGETGKEIIYYEYNDHLLFILIFIRLYVHLDELKVNEILQIDYLS